jgi:hypothetical protein
LSYLTLKIMMKQPFLQSPTMRSLSNPQTF